MKSQLFIAFVGLLLIACTSPGPIGGDTDAHGCLTGAGYSWDADIGACTRSWEVTGDLAAAAKTAVASMKNDNIVVLKVEPLRCPGCYEVQVKWDDTPYAIKVTGEQASTPEEIICGECPKYTPPGPGFCTNGEVVSGPVDACGCRGPPSCACTEEAKVCPDGSTVGRNPNNNCEFRPCDVEIANPASEFCESQGGTVKMVPGEGGMQGICVLSDGTECDEWEYFRGECPKDHVCSEEEKATEACTRDYTPVCGDDGVTYGNACSACSSGIIESWTSGECPKVTYVSRNPNQCAVIKFACVEGKVPFFDDIGCGCKPEDA